MNLLDPARELKLAPEDPMFCARRLWDQSAESGFGKAIEDKFQVVAQRLAESKAPTVEPGMHDALTRMYLLWRQRAILVRSPPQAARLRGSKMERQLSIDEQERLERNGLISSLGPT